MTTLVQYDAARKALAAATRIDEVLPLRAQMEHLKLHARQVQNRDLLADATEIQIRAERKLGQLLQQAEKEGLLHVGRPPKPDPNNSAGPARFTLKEIGVTNKLSASAQKKASISERAVELIIKGTRERILSGGATVIEQVSKTADKKAARATREKVLAGIQCALPDKKYGVIYADPEWRFETYSRDTGMDRSADNHYPTTATDAICSRPVPSIAADDCALFLWATAPMMPDALKVMVAWGFTYKSQSVWAKDRIGTGYWFRNKHELLLVGTKGKIPAPAMGEQWPSVIDAKVGKHSAKPEKFYELIEHYFPNLPKIELNARQARAGWDSWGNQAPAESCDAKTGEIFNCLDIEVESDSVPVVSRVPTQLANAGEGG